MAKLEFAAKPFIINEVQLRFDSKSGTIIATYGFEELAKCRWTGERWEWLYGPPGETETWHWVGDGHSAGEHGG